MRDWNTELKALGNDMTALVAITNNPYEGLKLETRLFYTRQSAASVAITNNPYEGLKQRWNPRKWGTVSVAITNNPYEGLKRRLPGSAAGSQ